MLAVYVQFYLFGFCICKCIKCSDKYNCIRIDIIFSSDYDRLFIGVSKNDNLSYYIAKFEYFLNDIDKFILQKNNIKDKGFYLKGIIKGNNMINDICYIEDVQTELEGLVYILNERLINNNQQQYFNECPPPPNQ
jgi:hypothetical protein